MRLGGGAYNRIEKDVRITMEPWILKQYFHKLQQEADLFELEVARHLNKGDVVLDAGCGSGEFGVLENCGKPASKIVGMDANAEALEKNTYVDEKIVGNLDQIPCHDDSFDLIVCEDVFEHLEQPQKVLKEFSRVLKKNGYLIVRTPNIWNLRNAISASLPVVVRRWLKTKLLKSSSEGTFETYFRCNSRRRFRRLCNRAGLREESLITQGHCPGYWGNRATVSLFTLYEWLTDSKLFAFSRVLIVGVYSKC